MITTGKAGGDHFGNFHKDVRSRNPKDLNAPVETAHLSSSIAHLGNIAFRVGRVLHFDPAEERFLADKWANTMLKRDYREPFVIPEEV